MPDFYYHNAFIFIPSLWYVINKGISLGYTDIQYLSFIIAPAFNNDPIFILIILVLGMVTRCAQINGYATRLLYYKDGAAMQITIIP